MIVTLSARLNSRMNTECEINEEAFSSPLRRRSRSTFPVLSIYTQQKEICDCGWSAIYSAQFGVDDYPCYDKVQESMFQFSDRSKIPVDWQSERNVRHTTYQGKRWNVHTELRRIKSVGSEEENLVYEEGRRRILQGLRFELGVIWLRSELGTFELAASFCRWFKSGHIVGPKGMDLNSQIPRLEPNSNSDASKRLRSRKDIDTGPDSVSKRDYSVVFVISENVEFEQGSV
jgi:hypothetical protein